MAWRTLTDAESAVLTGMRIERTGVGIVVGVIANDGYREAVS